MIKCRNIKKIYNNKEILESITFSINEGERASLIGIGGGGKSTLLRILVGLENPDMGSIEISGVDVHHCHPQVKIETIKKIGIAFQKGGLFDYMTVAENLLFTMENMIDIKTIDVDERISFMLSAMDLLHTKDYYPHELSGGMQRRVGIARALCTEPQIAFFDEPTAGLDPITSSMVLDMLLSTVGGDKQTTILVATSNIEIAMRFSERIILIYEGRVIADGPWKDLLVEGSEWVKMFLTLRLRGLDLGHIKRLGISEDFYKEILTLEG
jgi:phospholipid/cholesterol/gamma-HCH transport system ATP-binding protein